MIIIFLFFFFSHNQTKTTLKQNEKRWWTMTLRETMMKTMMDSPTTIASRSWEREERCRSLESKRGFLMEDETEDQSPTRPSVSGPGLNSVLLPLPTRRPSLKDASRPSPRIRPRLPSPVPLALQSPLAPPRSSKSCTEITKKQYPLVFFHYNTLFLFLHLSSHLS